MYLPGAGLDPPPQYPPRHRHPRLLVAPGTEEGALEEASPVPVSVSEEPASVLEEPASARASALVSVLESLSEAALYPAAANPAKHPVAAAREVSPPAYPAAVRFVAPLLSADWPQMSVASTRLSLASRTLPVCFPGQR